MSTHTPRKTFTQRIQDRLAARRNGEQGLALLDVLLGMAIFALIVIIAIQAIGQFRQRAFQTGANSDAKQVSVAIESALSDTGTPPATAAAVAALPGINLTRGNTVGWYVVGTGANSSDYLLCIQHATGGTADAASLYNSARGAIVDSARGRGCGAAPAYNAAAAALPAIP